MKKTGDLVLDTLFKCFRSFARTAVQQGHGVNLDSCLERAIAETRSELRKHRIDERAIRERIWPEEDNIRHECRKIIVGLEKKANLLDIRKTSVDAILGNFVSRTGLDLKYRLRENSTAVFVVKLQPSGQYLRFSASFTKILSQAWLDKMERDLSEFMGIASRLGRIRVSSHQL